MNNHVSKTEKNVVSLSHEEVVAVKQAFVRALREGGVAADELARVRAQLGLAPQPPRMHSQARFHGFAPPFRLRADVGVTFAADLR